MTFVDASAMVGILNRESDADELAARLDAADDRFTSPLAIYEATLGVWRRNKGTIAESRQDVMDLILRAGIRIIAITPAEADIALAAFARYGKGQGHRAQLNMGDCFAYAAARHHGAAMLFKGDDLAHTDVVLA